MSEGILCTIAVLLWVVLGGSSASGETVLEDGFEFFELGETWKEHGAGVPDVQLAPGFADGSEVLIMQSSGQTEDFFGIETITPISLTGVGKLTVDARLRPINMGVEGAVAAAEVAIIGSKGEFVRAFASNNAGPDPETANDWADHYEDSSDNVANSNPWPHCDVACDAVRNLVVSVTATGTMLQAFDDLDDPLAPTWEASFDNFTLGNLGSSVVIALRQKTVEGGDDVMGFFDNILVTTSGAGPVVGDYSGNGVLDSADLDLQAVAIGVNGPVDPYDLNQDGAVTYDDRKMWVNDLKKTYIGDVDLSGEFTSSDLVAVFVAGKYETGQAATWAQGDFDGDEEFDSSDLVQAFVEGGYELGPRAAVSAVPEPSSGALLILGGLVCFRRRRR